MIDRAPEAIQRQLTLMVQEIREALVDNLVGVYLHGSLAMGCFNAERSDLDLLVVTAAGTSVEVKRQIAEVLLRRSGAPRPIEISFLRSADLDPWQYPTPFDLHYSEDWRTRYEDQLANGEWKRWNDRERPQRDPDLAAHVTIVRHRGRCLVGKPIAEVFPEVPREHYLASILTDFDWLQERLIENPVYAVLNACRIYWYVREGRISSKAEAGAWAAQTLPEEHRGLVVQALEIYRGRRADSPFDAVSLKRFVAYVADEIARERQ